MSETIASLIVIVSIGLITHLILRRKKKKPVASRRAPHRAEPVYIRPTARLPATRTPVPVSSSPRKPHLTDDREYMTYRNCPDCHSENEIGNQVIFKLAPHQFICTVCGKNFKS